LGRGGGERLKETVNEHLSELNKQFTGYWNVAGDHEHHKHKELSAFTEGDALRTDAKAYLARISAISLKALDIVASAYEAESGAD
jgi:hypothetical protein